MRYDLRAGYFPGAIGECLSLHMAYYAAEWGFGIPFEAKLAREMAPFFENYDPDRDLFLSAAGRGGRVAATIAIDGSDGHGGGAHLRWFIANGRARGSGLGNRLIGRAMRFCGERDYARVWLTTFRGLDTARHLYEKHGFRLASENHDDQWQGSVTEQRFEWRAGGSTGG